MMLKTYTGEHIKILGSTQVLFNYNEKEKTLPAHVVDSEGPNLMGRDWLRKFEVVLSRLCNHVGTGANQSSLEQVLSKHVEVFGDQLGTLRGYKAKL